MKTREEILKSIAKGNKDAGLKVISLGLGVQSTAVYLMSSMGILPRADYAIFSDPQAEHYKTYEILAWLLEWKDNNDGIEIIVNKDRSISEDYLNKNLKRRPSIPAFNKSGIIRRQCTSEYKIMGIRKEIRKLHKLDRRKWMKPTEQWFGISLDEIERVKKSNEYNITFFYPLIYMGMSRKDCIDFFKEHNFPVPVKSSCVFCPFHSNKFWKEIQKEDGDAWKLSVRVDKSIRDSKKYNLNEELFLHPSCIPLEEIDFDDRQESLFDDDLFECEGYCGL